MPLTPSEIDQVRSRYVVVGTRPDGARLVLVETVTATLAWRLRDRFAALLEGYESVTVEEIGGSGTVPEPGSPEPERAPGRGARELS